MKSSWWRQAEYRRDVLIVLGWFGLGVILNVAVGLVVFWLLTQLGWLNVPLDALWSS